MSRRRVTAIALCSFCGEPFTPRRSDAAYCSNRHRQAAYRRRRVTDTGTAPVRLTFELRARLRAEIDRRRRVALEAEQEALRIRDAGLFREDVAA